MPCLGNPKFVHNNNLGSKTSWDTLLLADALAIPCVVLEGCQEDGDPLVARVVHAQRCGLSLPLQASQDNSQLEVPHTSGKGEIKNMGINHYNLHLRLPISYLFIFFFFLHFAYSATAKKFLSGRLWSHLKSGFIFIIFITEEERLNLDIPGVSTLD